MVLTELCVVRFWSVFKSNLHCATGSIWKSLEPEIILTINPLTPMSDQSRISPQNINTITTR